MPLAFPYHLSVEGFPSITRVLNWEGMLFKVRSTGLGLSGQQALENLRPSWESPEFRLFHHRLTF